MWKLSSYKILGVGAFFVLAFLTEVYQEYSRSVCGDIMITIMSLKYGRVKIFHHFKKLLTVRALANITVET